ncbi:hypothetical protein HKD37_13G037292 [Glycine soja]
MKSDGCVKYVCMELKCDDDVGKIFFVYSEFSTNGLIELNATFKRFLDEILVLLHKSRIADESITLMPDESV